MINSFIKYFRRPERGWDPIPSHYAIEYSNAVYSKVQSQSILQNLTKHGFSLKNNRILDLGAGPGEYSMLFARYGAKVTWHDISQNYLSIAKQHAQASGHNIEFSLGYLEDSTGLYDLVFVSQCWCYCINDYSFANKIVSLVKDGGLAYIVINNDDFFWHKLSGLGLVKRYLLIFQFFLNDIFNFKIGHPHPSHTKVLSIFSRFKFVSLDIVKDNFLTTVIFRK